VNRLERAILWTTPTGLVVLVAFYIFNHLMQPALPSSWDYKDVVTILLAIVTISLTVLGILIAIAAFISYQKIVDLAGERAETASEQFLVSPAFQTRVDLLISERMKNAQTDELEAKLDVTQDNTGPGSAADEPWIDP
jgi:hypothetical protein